MFEITALRCEVCWNEDRSVALVTPVCHARSDRKRHAVFSFDLDGFELLPSCGASVEEGESILHLPPVRVHHPEKIDVPFRCRAVLHVHEDGHTDVETQFEL